MQRALTLTECALSLMDQNTDTQINEWTLHNNIAEIYISLDQTEKALDALDAMLLSSCAIACDLQGDTEAALRYISDAIQTAKRFDASPDFSFMTMKFIENAKQFVGFSSLGTSSTASIKKRLLSCEELSEALRHSVDEL